METPRLKLVILTLGILTLALLLGQIKEPKVGPTDTETTDAPGVSIPLSAGAKPTPLATLKGKVVLIDFWASWCGPCKVSIPELETVYKKYQGKGLIVIGMSEDDPQTRRDAAETVQSLGMTYPIVFAQDYPNLQSGFPHDGIPALYAIDKKGKIRWHQIGYASNFDLDGEVSKLIRE